MNTGEMRTAVRVEVPDTREEDGREITRWRDAYSGRRIMARFRRRYSSPGEKNADGRHYAPDTYEVTTRFTPAVTADCRIVTSDGTFYVISSPARSQNGAWLTFYVEKRDGAA